MSSKWFAAAHAWQTTTRSGTRGRLPYDLDEPFLDDREELRQRARLFEPVRDAGKRLEPNVTRRGRGDPLGVLERHDVVRLAVHDEERLRELADRGEHVHVRKIVEKRRAHPAFAPAPAALAPPLSDVGRRHRFRE